MVDASGPSEQSGARDSGGDADFVPMFGAAELRDMFGIFRDYVKHEDGLVQHRLNWMLVSNGLLVTGYTALASYMVGQAWTHLQVVTVAEGLCQTAMVANQQRWLVVLLMLFTLAGTFNSLGGAADVSAARLSIASLRQYWEMTVLPLALPRDRRGRTYLSTDPKDRGKSAIRVGTLLRYARAPQKFEVASSMDDRDRRAFHLPNLTFGMASRRQQMLDYALSTCIVVFCFWLMLLIVANLLVWQVVDEAAHHLSRLAGC